MEIYTENGDIICQLCDKAFKAITPQHLKKLHNTTTAEYRLKYSDLPMISKSVMAKHQYNREKLFNKIVDEIPVEKSDIFDLDKIPKISVKINQKSEDILKDVEIFEDNSSLIEYPNPNNLIHKHKLSILNFLLSYFQDVKDSYFIEKYNISRILEYKLITDICIPSKFIDLEFPNTFWHNMDIPKFNRDVKLKNDGWIILDILDNKPSIENIKKILITNNLIRI